MTEKTLAEFATKQMDKGHTQYQVAAPIGRKKTIVKPEMEETLNQIYAHRINLVKRYMGEVEANNMCPTTNLCPIIIPCDNIPKLIHNISKNNNKFAADPRCHNYPVHILSRYPRSDLYEHGMITIDRQISDKKIYIHKNTNKLHGFGMLRALCMDLGKKLHDKNNKAGYCAPGYWTVDQDVAYVDGMFECKDGMFECKNQNKCSAAGFHFNGQRINIGKKASIRTRYQKGATPLTAAIWLSNNCIVNTPQEGFYSTHNPIFILSKEDLSFSKQAYTYSKSSPLNHEIKGLIDKFELMDLKVDTNDNAEAEATKLQNALLEELYKTEKDYHVLHYVSRDKSEKKTIGDWAEGAKSERKGEAACRLSCKLIEQIFNEKWLLSKWIDGKNKGAVNEKENKVGNQSKGLGGRRTGISGVGKGVIKVR